MTTERVRASYDTVAASYAERITGLSAESPLEIALIDRFADEMVQLGGKTLDAGSGPGRVSDYLAGRGVAVSGIDLSPAMVAVASAAYPALHFEVGSLAALPVRDGALSGILAWYSTIHSPIEELSAIYREFVRALAPGGRLLLGFHSGTGDVHVTNSYGHDVDIDVQLFDAAELSALLEDAGFAVDVTLVRAPVGSEKRPQGFLLARKS